MTIDERYPWQWTVARLVFVAVFALPIAASLIAALSTLTFGLGPILAGAIVAGDLPDGTQTERIVRVLAFLGGAVGFVAAWVVGCLIGVLAEAVFGDRICAEIPVVALLELGVLVALLYVTGGM
jgi:hypothetical protein